MKVPLSCLIIVSALSSVAALPCQQCCDISKDLTAQNDIKNIINETLKEVLGPWNLKYWLLESETVTLKEMVQELNKKVESLRDQSNSAQSCPSGWVKNGSSCYKFIQSPLKTWAGAKTYCSDLQSNLVEIEDNSENEFLRKNLAPLPITGDIRKLVNQFWIGNSDLDNEGVWTWATTGSVGDYTDWWQKTDEPNGGTDENCGTMAAKMYYHWNDSDCDLKLNFICEKHLSN